MTSRPRSKLAYARAIWSVPLPLRVAIIIVAVALVYLPALHAGFVWDDELLITANPLLRDLSGLFEIWTGGRTADYYPLTNTIFWIEWHLFGQQAAGYHAVNIVLQVANALLVWLVLRRFHVPGAWVSRSRLRHSSGACRIGSVDIGIEKLAFDVLRSVVRPLFS